MPEPDVCSATRSLFTCRHRRRRRAVTSADLLLAAEQVPPATPGWAAYLASAFQSGTSRRSAIRPREPRAPTPLDLALPSQRLAPLPPKLRPADGPARRPGRPPLRLRAGELARSLARARPWQLPRAQPLRLPAGAPPFRLPAGELA